MLVDGFGERKTDAWKAPLLPWLADRLLASDTELTRLMELGSFESPTEDVNGLELRKDVTDGRSPVKSPAARLDSDVVF